LFFWGFGVLGFGGFWGGVRVTNSGWGKCQNGPRQTTPAPPPMFSSTSSPKKCGIAFLFAPALAVASGLARATDPLPPLWGPVFTVPFNQSITIMGMRWDNTVQFSYDSTTRPVGSSLYVHSKGQHDELCTSIVGKELSDEPCSLLASVDTWRYVIFPQSRQCCRYCNTTQYCGIIRPDWLTNATYQGTRDIGGYASNGWMKKGGEENYYWATADSRQWPVQYYEGYPTFECVHGSASRRVLSPSSHSHRFPPCPSPLYILSSLQSRLQLLEFYHRPILDSPHSRQRVCGACGLGLRANVRRERDALRGAPAPSAKFLTAAADHAIVRIVLTSSGAEVVYRYVFPQL